LARHFIAGILAHAREIALATNSCVNSYKRLVPGYEAPVCIGWGYGNRSVLIRVPTYRADDVNRVEIRSPDPVCDPYLAFAALLKAGMEGIEEEMKVPKPCVQNVYGLSKRELASRGIDMLPANLAEAIDMAREGHILGSLLGSHFDRFIRIKEREWEEYHDYLRGLKKTVDIPKVTEWERKRYFHM
jgi:glutamine synthetase